VHGVQRLSLANNRFKHMHDSAKQKAAIASGTGVDGKVDWVWGFDPVAQWDKDPVVPAVYASETAVDTAASIS